MFDWILERVLQVKDELIYNLLAIYLQLTYNLQLY